MEYSRAIEPLITKMVAISYKTLVNIPLSESDKRHMEYILECAKMYDNMASNDKVIHEEKKVEQKEKENKAYNWFDEIPDTIPENWFKDDTDEIPDIFTDSRELTVHNDFKDKKEEKKEDEITFETNEQLMEIAKNNKIKFDELTKKCTEELKNINDSFWTVIEIK
jgi:hypothetical protein